MSTRLLQLIASVLAIQFIMACEPNSSAKFEQELASIKQDINQLRQDITKIGSQVTDIHTIAMSSKKTQHKTLPTLENIDADGRLPSIGTAGAEIAIIEFSDYQCPYCKRYIEQTFTELKRKYIDTGKVRYLTRDFPLSFHPNAKDAAIAAKCSLRQDAYWPMRESLFNNMRQLGDKLYQQTASELALDMTQFTECLKDESVLGKIEQDMAYGSQLGIRGTPSFIIGRVEDNRLISPRLVVGAQSFETFAQLIDELLVNDKQ